MGPQRAIRLGFVDTGSDAIPEAGKGYQVVDASSNKVGARDYPKESGFLRAEISLLGLYIEDLPDWGRNEGLFRLQTKTRDPNSPGSGTTDLSFSTDFLVRNGNPAPGFLFNKAFRNVVFQDELALRFDLFESDEDLDKTYYRMKPLIDTIKMVDVIAGLPYVTLATSIAETVIKIFGKNPDDHIWGETPSLELLPGIGGAFLRSGIYVAYEQRNVGDRQDIPLNGHLVYRDTEVRLSHPIVKKMSNHLLFNVKLRAHAK